jgi:hypothetical protein
VVVLAAAWAVTSAWRRRRHLPGDRLPAGMPLSGPLAGAWVRIDRALIDASVARPPSRSPSAYAGILRRCAADHIGDAEANPGQLAMALADLSWVAELTERSVFGAESFDAATVAEAEAASHRVSRALRQPEVRSALVRLRTEGRPRTAV